MTIEERIASLREFREEVVRWRDARADLKDEIRRSLNESKPAIRREVIEAGCYKSFTIGPPPAIGGLVHRGVDPFDNMFEPPYGADLLTAVLDMLDTTVGVMSDSDYEQRLAANQAANADIEEDIRHGYVFVAMPIDPDDPELQDVMEAIREACNRCGLTAERVDETHTNERITDRILESIRQAQCVVVDLTGSKPNVFYEAGYAQGLGKTPIYVARSGTRLEFDLQDYPVIFFRNLTGLRNDLEARLRGLACGDE